MNTPNCTCRHGDHEDTPCFWETPGGGLIGQACDCETYTPCVHPLAEKTMVVFTSEKGTPGHPHCNACAQHFKDEADYLEGRKVAFLKAREFEHKGMDQIWLLCVESDPDWYWDGDGITQDPMSAVQFVRKEDAEMVAHRVVRKNYVGAHPSSFWVTPKHRV